MGEFKDKMVELQHLLQLLEQKKDQLREVRKREVDFVAHPGEPQIMIEIEELEEEIKNLSSRIDSLKAEIHELQD